MLNIKGKSAWQWDTSVSTSIAGGAALAGGGTKGTFYLKSPEGGTFPFRYFLAGLGTGYGFKVGATHSTPETFSTGEVHILNSFKGKELQAKDLLGVCMAIDLSIGIGLGGGITGMVLGIPGDSESMANQLAIALLEGAAAVGGGAPAMKGIQIMENKLKIIDSAKAILVMRGLNAGPNIGATILGMAGLVWMGDLEQSPIYADFKGHEDHDILLRSSRSGYEVITLPGNVLFDWDSDKIGTKANPKQAEDALTFAGKKILAKRPTEVKVEGHADSTPGIGDPNYNQKLSERRAKNVAQWLIRHNYSRPAGTFSMGSGDRKPVATNATKEGREMNRRVEIKLIYG